ncbi:polysaccharide pyruvyl transferase family protein [Ruminococcus sp. OF03-6AA]|nr:polysaccharide pyruvyl transferase family protein [Ruminococcus sp. OF03-6AA]
MLKTHIRKKREFYRFLNQNVRISTEVYDKFNIDKANLRYDKFITGSDQVFNFACTDFDKTYFLQFVKNCDNKLSYAASFGMKEIPDSYVNDYKSLLSTFSELSIRENAGQQIVKKLTGKDSELSVDPVFLLTAEEWEKLAKKPKLKNYILIYKLNTSNLIFDFARKLSKLTGRKIVALNFDVVDQMKTPDIKGVYSASVEEFLGYVKYADYVVTNSFHGTAFSVIFIKIFMWKHYKKILSLMIESNLCYV